MHLYVGQRSEVTRRTASHGKALLSALLVVSTACEEAAEEFGTELLYVGESGQPTDAVIEGWTPFVEVHFGKGEPRDFLVDTGAPLTHLDSAVYQLDDVVYGEIFAFGLVFENRPLVPLQLFGAKSKVQQVCFGLRPGGLLGGDVLRGFRFAGDYLERKLYVFADDTEVPTSAALESKTTTDVRIRGGGRFRTDAGSTVEGPPTRVLVDVEVEGEPTTMLVDTGATYVSVSPSLIERLGSGDRPFLGDVTVLTATAGIVETKLSRLGAVSIGGDAEVENVPVLVLADELLLDDISEEAGERIDGLLGGTFLREFLYTIDYPRNELVLERYSNPDHIDRSEFIGPGFDIIECDDVFFVGEIYEDTGVDELANLQSGDRVIRIGSQMLAGLTIEEVTNLYRSATPGSVVAFSFDRSGNRPDGAVDIEIRALLPEIP